MKYQVCLRASSVEVSETYSIEAENKQEALRKLQNEFSKFEFVEREIDTMALDTVTVTVNDFWEADE